MFLTDAVDEMSDLENENAANQYLEVYKLTLKGDWGTLRDCLERDPSLLHAKIAGLGDTVLHVAVSTGHSADFVSSLVEYVPASCIELRNDVESTPLHFAAIAGNTVAAKILVKKNPGTPLLRNRDGHTPLYHAAQFGHRQTFCFLSNIPDQDPSPFAEGSGREILKFLITADFYG